MPKACLNCGTDNRDEALFCRRCGTPFSPSQASPSTAEPTLPGGRSSSSAATRVLPATPDAPGLPRARVPLSTALPSFGDDDEDEDDETAGGRTVFATGVPCPACGSGNAAGSPICARCGAALGPVGNGPQAPFAGAEATIVMKQPPRGVGHPSYPPVPPAQVPPAGPGTAGASRAAAGTTVPKDLRSSSAGRTSSVSRNAFWLALALGMLLIAGLGFWLLGPRTPKSLPDEPAPVAVPAASAALAPLPAASPADVTSAPPPPATSGAGTASASAAVFDPAGSSPTASALGAGPGLAASAVSAEDEAKAAKLKLERAARAKALRESRDPASAAKRTEQDAAAQRQADDRTRAVDAAASTASAVRHAAAPLPPRPGATAQEFCAGRGTIGTAVCESRQCGRPEHADEARCRQVNAEEERRR